MTDEARAAPEQTVEPRTEAGRWMVEAYGAAVAPAILAIERETAAVAAPPLDPEKVVHAIHAVICPFYRPGPSHMDHGPDLFDAEHAAAILAYLSHPSPDEPREPWTR